MIFLKIALLLIFGSFGILSLAGFVEAFSETSWEWGARLGASAVFLVFTAVSALLFLAALSM